MYSLVRRCKALLTTLGCLAFIAGCGGGGGGGGGQFAIAQPPPAELTTVVVTPVDATVPSGAPQQYVATASFADGTSRDVTGVSTWTSATPAAASVASDTGLAIGASPGTTVIGALFGGKAGSATLTVTTATLQSVAIAPVNRSIAGGLTQQFSATGAYGDGTMRDITAISSFTSNAPSVATISSSSGLATGVTAGNSVITASAGGKSASTILTVTAATLVSIALNPVPPVLQIGATQQLIVTGTYTDHTVADVSAGAAYASATPAVATVGASTGLVSGVSAGSSLITATFGGRTASTGVTVAAATLVSIGVTPSTPSILNGSTQQMTATGTYSDGSTAGLTSDVTWSSSSTTVATILSGGMATGHNVGLSTISASLGAVSGNTSLTVTAAPPANTINLGTASTFGVLAGTLLTNNSGGTTLISGDIGAPAQAVDPVQPMGYANYKSGAILASALSDLQVAVTDANSRPCDISFGAAIDLGGSTLTPGVYCYGGAISLTGILTLSGSGLYIFRTLGALTTAAGSQVALAAGASDDNVFFVPAGATVVGANSVFRGTLLSGAGAITLGDSTTVLRGRALTGAAVTLQNNLITVP
ncbi:MAG: ice-binding family protein [Variovorax sp.]